MTAMKFDKTLNIGHLLTAGTILIGGFTVYSGIRQELTQIDLRMTQVETQSRTAATKLDRITDLLTADARHEALLSGLTARLEAIERREELVRAGPQRPTITP